jgi:4a-hydroxytetrahydrobiopterin dehydratase
LTAPGRRATVTGMTRLLDLQEVARQLADLPAWRWADDALHCRYDAPDFRTAVRLVGAVAEVAEEMDHHPDVDLRWRRVQFGLSTHSAGGVTQLDVELAHRIAAEAAALGAGAEVSVPVRVEIAVDAADPGALLPFWQAGLGYAVDTGDDGERQLVDPAGRGPTVWFQPMDPRRGGRNRVHVDVYVPPADAPGRVAAVLAAGGRLVTDEHAPSWWVLADPEGNELCVCADG